MQSLLDVILPVFLVIGFGYAAVWKGYFSDAGVEGLMKFTQNFAIPCLLFRAIAGLDLSQSFNLPLLLSYYTGASASFLAGLLGARYLFRRPWTDSVAIGFCSLFSNGVLLGLPITEKAFGAGALQGNYAIIALHTPFCYALGLTAMEMARNKGSGFLTTLRGIGSSIVHNVMILGIALGFLVNVTEAPIPAVLGEALNLMIQAAIPAALFGLGGVLVRYRPEGDMLTIAYVCAVSLILQPAIVWTIGNFVGLNTAQLRSAVLTAAMAPGVNTYIFANMYGVAKRVAASTVLIGTMLSLVTVWFWLMILP